MNSEAGSCHSETQYRKHEQVTGTVRERPARLAQRLTLRNIEGHRCLSVHIELNTHKKSHEPTDRGVTHLLQILLSIFAAPRFPHSSGNRSTSSTEISVVTSYSYPIIFYTRVGLALSNAQVEVD